MFEKGAMNKIHAKIMLRMRFLFDRSFITLIRESFVVTLPLLLKYLVMITPLPLVNPLPSVSPFPLVKPLPFVNPLLIASA